MTLKPRPTRDPTRFTGDVWVDMLTRRRSCAVRFAPARTRPGMTPQRSDPAHPRRRACRPAARSSRSVGDTIPPRISHHRPTSPFLDWRPGTSPNGATTSPATSTPGTPNAQRDRGTTMTDEEPERAQRAIGDFAPKLVELTDDVLFGECGNARSCPSGTAAWSPWPPGGRRQHRAAANHLLRAKENGLTETELKEAIIHLAFYAGWPRAMSPSRSPKPPSPTEPPPRPPGDSCLTTTPRRWR